MKKEILKEILALTEEMEDALSSRDYEGIEFRLKERQRLLHCVKIEDTSFRDTEARDLIREILERDERLRLRMICELKEVKDALEGIRKGRKVLAAYRGSVSQKRQPPRKDLYR